VGTQAAGPLLLLRLARPELLELRPARTVGAPRTTLIELEPLDAGDATALLDALAAAPPEPAR
jgi:hypothetical protein